MCKKKQKNKGALIHLQKIKITDIFRMNNLIKWSETDFNSRKIKDTLLNMKSHTLNILCLLNLYQNQLRHKTK